MFYSKWALSICALFSLTAGALLQAQAGTQQKPDKPAAAQKEKPEQAEPATPALALFRDAKPEDYIGDKACTECHSTEVENFPRSVHAHFSADPSTPLGFHGCESCHGPGRVHKENEGGNIVYFNKIKPAEVDAVCLRCHTDVMKPAKWRHEGHARAGVSCIGCHQVHPTDTPETMAQKSDRGLLKKRIFPAAKPADHLLKTDQATLCGTCHQSEVAEFRQNSHHPVPEGRLVCSDCHTLHPNTSTEKKPMLVKDQCVTCHAEKAGPFVYEHDPVAGWMGDGCKECHKPHGSHNPELLRAFSRGVCAQCHTDKLATHFPGKSCWNAGCHIALHGSNSDPKFLAR